MLSFDTFIIISLVTVLAVVGLLAWMIDAGISEKKKAIFKYSLFGLLACFMGLFFMIEDDTEFEYGGWEKQAKNGQRQSRSFADGAGGVTEYQEGGGPSGGGGEGNIAVVPEDKDALKPDCDKCPEMVKIKPGTALLGAPLTVVSGSAATAPADRISVVRGYAIGKYEITVGEFAAFVKETGYKPSQACRIGPTTVRGATFQSPGFKQDKDYPVVCVSWTDANFYTDWLSQKSGRVYRLPTEVEWEFAARGGVTSRFLTGGEISSARANFADPLGEKRSKAIAVGSFDPNPNKMYDVHGNVWEFTNDCWSRGYYRHNSAQGADQQSCSKRIVKGGSWFSSADQMDLAMRAAIKSTMASNGIGFRVMREAEKPPVSVSADPKSAANGFGMKKPAGGQIAGPGEVRKFGDVKKEADEQAKADAAAGRPVGSSNSRSSTNRQVQSNRVGGGAAQGGQSAGQAGSGELPPEVRDQLRRASQGLSAAGGVLR